MKKFIFLLAIMFLASFSFLSAQNFAFQNQDVSVEAKESITRSGTRAELELGYCDGTINTFYGTAVTTSYISGCISFTAEYISNFVGMQLHTIEAAIPPQMSGTTPLITGMTSYKVWVKTSLNGAVAYEEDVTAQVNPGAAATFNMFELATPYTVTAGPLYIGVTIGFNLGTSASRYPLPTETANAPYPAGAYNFIISQSADGHGVTPAGETWTTGSGRALCIWGHVTGDLANTNNLCAAGIATTTPLKIVGGSNFTAKVIVYNAGTNPQSNYTVQLLNASDNSVVGTQAVTTSIASGAYAKIDVPLPSTAGEITLKGKVVLTGDGNALDDITTATASEYIYPIQPLSYCDNGAVGAASAGPNIQHQAAIGYTDVNSGPYAGKILTAIRVAFGVPSSTLSNCKIWIASSLTTTISAIYEQPFTPTADGWMTIVLDTPYELPATTTYIGWTGTSSVTGIMGYVTYAPQVDDGGRIQFSTGAWTTLAAALSSAGIVNNALIGVIENMDEPPACNPPTALNVSYATDCNSATLTWTAPTGKSAAPFNKFIPTKGPRPVRTTADKQHTANRASASMSTQQEIPEMPELMSRGSMAYGNIIYPSAQLGLRKWDVDAAATTTLIKANMPDLAGGAYYDGYLYAYEAGVDEDYYYTDVTFHKIDPNTGNSVSAIPKPELYGWPLESMSYDYSTNTMYGMIDNTLFIVDLETGDYTEVAECSGYTNPGDDPLWTLAISLDGTMYTICGSVNGDHLGTLYTINKSNGVCSLVGATTVDAWYSQSMGFDYSDGTLYWCAIDFSGPSFSFRKINVTNATTTLLANTSTEVVCFFVPYDGDAPPAGDFTYNIYRNGNKINTAPVTTETYTDNTFSASAGHTWAVKVICDTGEESDAAEKSMPACYSEPGDCNPPQNLNVVYDENCGKAELTWESPTGKKSTPKPYIYEEAGYTTTEEGMTREERRDMNPQYRTANGTTVTSSSVSQPTKLDIPRAPKGMVNVTLEAHDVWHDGSGYQLLLDATATEYGNTIPTGGALAQCPVSPSLYDVFTHKIPENATATCSSHSTFVVNGSVTVQIPAGTYDWCLANLEMPSTLWIAGGEGAQEGRRDNYVFEDGYKYHFVMSGTDDGDWVDIYIELDGDPCPAVSNVTATATGNSVTVNWTASTGSPQSYEVYRNNQLLQAVTPPATTYTDTNVPDGMYTYAVKAIYPAADDCIPQTVSATPIMVGNMCEVQVIVSSLSTYADQWSWTVIDDGGITLIGGGSQSGQGAITIGTKSALFTGTATFHIWVHGTIDDNTVTMSVMLNGEQIFSHTGYILYGFDETREMECGYSIKYNIYRDGEKLNATPIKPTAFTDDTFAPTEAHTWEVKVICEDGSESESAIKEMPFCYDPDACNPPINLTATYLQNCSVQLKWKKPMGTKSAKATLDQDDIAANEFYQTIDPEIEYANMKAAQLAKEEEANKLNNPVVKASVEEKLAKRETMKKSGAPKSSTPDKSPKAVLFSEDFENENYVGGLPTGWTSINTTDYDDWFVDDYWWWGHNDSWQYAMSEWDNGEGDQNKWMITSGITLTQGVTYTIKFWTQLGYDEGDGNNLEVKIGNAPTVAAMNSGTMIKNFVDYCTYFDWELVTYTFTPTTTGSYYIGFHDYSEEYFGYDILIDDITVEDAGAPPPPSGDCEDVICGTGASSNSYTLPGWYGWSRNILLYEASELGDAGAITEVAFNINSSNASLRPMKIYMMQTSASTVEATYAWNTIKAQATLVYDASIAFPTSGWNTVILDDSFAYDGAENLLVLVEGTGTTTSGGCSVSSYYSTKTNCHWYSNKDGSAPDDDASIGSRNSDRTNITFTICPALGDLTFNIYRDDVYVTTVNGLSYEDEENNALTGHTWKVTQVCVDDVESEPAEVTLEDCPYYCYPPTDLTAAYNEDCEVELTWEGPDGGKGVAAEGTLSTIPFSGTAQGGGVSFDMIAGPQNISITEIEFPIGGTGARAIQAYYRTGTSCGNATSATGWLPIGSGVINVNVAGAAPATTPVTFPTPVTIPAGETVGFWFAVLNAGNDGIKYNASSTGSTVCGTATTASNSDLTIKGGTGLQTVTAPFASATWIEREFTGVVHYNTGGSGGGNGTYNIYRDDELIASTKETFYTDIDNDPDVGHAYEVKAVCSSGESDPAFAQIDVPCVFNCEPVTELAIDFTPDCHATITWEPPTGKKSAVISTPTGENNNMEREQGNMVARTERGEKGEKGALQFSTSGKPNNNNNPQEKGPDDWIKWCGANVDGIGLGSPVTFILASRYLPADLSAMNVVTGDLLTRIKFVVWYASSNTCTLKVYQGGTSPTNPGTEVYSQLVTQPLVNEDYTDVELTTPVIIDASQELWIAYELVHNGYDYPGGNDAGPRVAGKGDLMYWNGEWTDLWTASGTNAISANWNIEGFVVTGNVNIAAAPANVNLNPTGTTLNGTLSWTNPSQTMAGTALTSITKMVVQRDGAPYDEFTTVTSGQNMSMPVSVDAAGNHTFTVYAVTSEGDGQKGNATAMFGDMCEITFVKICTWSTGWDGGSVDVYVNGQLYANLTSSSTYQTEVLTVPSGELKLYWNGYTFSCECGLEVYDYDGNQLFASPAPGSWSTCQGTGQGMENYEGLFLTEQYSCSAIMYNVYRDGELLGTTKNNYFEDFGFDDTDHIWCVRVACDEGGQSRKECIEGSCAPCYPVTNLTGAFDIDCNFTLTWDAPAGKKSSPKPPYNYEEAGSGYTPTAEDLEKDALKEQGLTMTNFAASRTNPNPTFNTESPKFEEIGDGLFRGDSSPFIYSTPSSDATVGTFKTTLGGWNQPGTQLSTISLSYQAMVYANGEIGVVTYNDPTGTNTFGKLNPDNGTFTVVNSNNSQVPDAVSMAYNPIDGEVYVTQWQAPFGKINMATGVFTSIASKSDVLYIAIDLDGTCYYLSASGSGSDFGTMNLANGQTTSISSYAAANWIQDIGIDPETGILYHAFRDGVNSTTQWRTINKATGVPTTIGTFPSSRNVESWIIMAEAGDPCPAVTNVNATVTSGTMNVVVTWTPVSGATNNEVLRDGTVLATLSANANTYTDNTATPGDHTYCVKAIFPAADDCIPQSVCAPSVTVPEILGGGCEAAIVGNGTSTGYQIPVNTFYRYSYVQEIFDASELEGMLKKEISSISFQYIHNSPNPKNPLTVYVGPTTKSVFASTSDWVPVSELTQVFTGAVVFDNSQAWFTIYFDEPYLYDGGNLVIAILNNEGNYVTSSDPTFRHHTASGNKTIQYYVDGTTPINPATIGTASGTTSNRNNVRFVACNTYGYDVYLDDVLVGEGLEEMMFKYPADSFNYDEPHTWTVYTVCEGGKYSDGTSVTMKPCKVCDPPTNLVVYYNEDCEAVLEWEGDLTAKKIPFTPPTEMNNEPRADKGDKGGMRGNSLVDNNPNGKPIIDPPTRDWPYEQQFNWNLSTLGTTTSVATDGNFIYIGNFSNSDILKMDMSGNVLSTFNIPGISTLRALSYDGTDFYGATATSTIWKLDMNTQSIAQTISISGGHTARSLAYDPTQDAFWIADYMSGDVLYLVSKTGAILNTINPPSSFTSLYGTAVDHITPEGPYLFGGTAIQYQNGTIYQINLTTGQLTTKSWDSGSMGSELSFGGMFFTDKVVSGTWTLMTLLQNTALLGWNVAIANENLAGAPTNVTLTPKGTSLNGTFTWTNPTQTIGGAALTSITKMVVERNGAPYTEFTTVTPGQNMSLAVSVPDAGNYSFAVYAVTSEGNGSKASASATFGDLCSVSIEMWDDYGDGWNGGSVAVIVNGTNWGSATLASGQNYGTAEILVASGELQLSWNTGSYDCECMFKVFDPEGELIYASPQNGSFPCSTPGVGMYGLSGVVHTSDFSCGAGGDYFNIYKDGVLLEEMYMDNIYVDENLHHLTGHEWCVTRVCEWGETPAICASLPYCETGIVVYGVVKNANDIDFIEGATLKLEGKKNYEVKSAALGTFSFYDVVKADGYTLTITADGYQDFTTIVNVDGHTNLGTIYMLEIPYKPTNVVAVEAGENVNVTWGKPATLLNNGSGITGYKVWRLIAGQQNNPENWVALTNYPIPTLQYTDFSWANAGGGEYKWAVRTCYYGNVESAAEFSKDSIYKNVEVPYTIAITTNSGNSPVGAAIKLTNAAYTYEATSGATGYTFPAVWLGDYTLTITLDGYEDYKKDTLIIADAGTHAAKLIELIIDPKDVEVIQGEDCSEGTLTWTGSKFALNYTVYLDEVEVATTQGTEYKFVGLDEGSYKAGVQANFVTGTSNIVTDDLVICIGVNDYENGFGIYPNPANHNIYVARNTSDFATIDIYNAMGMHIQQYETTEAKFEINVSTLSAGAYFIKVTQGDNIGVKSFVKK